MIPTKKNLTANFIQNMFGYQPKNIFSSPACATPKLRWASRQDLRGPFQIKKNYKLGLLAQPKVGRCPEGV